MSERIQDPETEKAAQQINIFGDSPLGKRQRESPVKTAKTWLPTMPLADKKLNPPLPNWLSKKTVQIGQK